MSLKQIEKWANDAAAEWHEAHSTEEDVTAAIKERLDARVDGVIAKLLGFRPCYGEWEVDHCNGRGGESAAGDWLRKCAGKAVDQWLAEQAGSLPDLPVSATRALRREYLAAYKDALHERLCDLARARAKSAAERVFAEVCGKAAAE